MEKVLKTLRDYLRVAAGGIGGSAIFYKIAEETVKNVQLPGYLPLEIAEPYTRFLLPLFAALLGGTIGLVFGVYSVEKSEEPELGDLI